MPDRFIITETAGAQEVHALAGLGDYDTLCGYDPEGDPRSKVIGTAARAKINCLGCASIIREVRNNYTLRDLADTPDVSGL